MEEPERGINSNSQNCSSGPCSSYSAMGRFFQRTSAFDCMHPSQSGGVGLAPPHTGFGYSAYPGDWGFMHGPSYTPSFNFNRALNTPSNFYSVSRDFGTSLGHTVSGPPPLIGASASSVGISCEPVDNYGTVLCGESPCSPSSSDNCLSDDLDKKENKGQGICIISISTHFDVLVLSNVKDIFS